LAQLVGVFLGLLVVGIMFYSYNPTILTVSDNMKNAGQVFAEFVGTFLLIGVIFGCVRGGSKHTGLSVAFVVGGMLVTTSSTMFANPAITLNRMFTYAICGIAPSSGVLFIIAEIIGALTAVVVFTTIFPAKLKEKCQPFECPALNGARPITIGPEPLSAQTDQCGPFECPEGQKKG
jgi:glycerol uptake facilitator-like aquaporin